MGHRLDAPRGLFPTKAQGVLTVPLSALPRGMKLGKLASKFEQMLNLCDPEAIAPAEPSYTPRLLPEARDAVAPVKKTPCKGLALAQSAPTNNQEGGAEFEAMLLPDSIAASSMLETPSKVLHHASKFEEDHPSKASSSLFTLADGSASFDRHVSSPAPCPRGAPTPEPNQNGVGFLRGVSPVLPALANFGSQQAEVPKKAEPPKKSSSRGQDASQQVEPRKTASGAVVSMPSMPLQEQEPPQEQEPLQHKLIQHNVEEVDVLQNHPMEALEIDQRLEEQMAGGRSWATSRKSSKEFYALASTPTPPNEEVEVSQVMARYHQKMSAHPNNDRSAVGFTGQRSQSARGDRRPEAHSAARPWDDAPKGQPERPPPLPPWPQRRCNPAVLPRASKRCGETPTVATIRINPAPARTIRRSQRSRSGARFSAGGRRRINQSPVLEVNPNGVLDFPSYAIPRYLEAEKAAYSAHTPECSRIPSPCNPCRDTENGEHHHHEHQRPASLNVSETPSTHLATTPPISNPSSPWSGATPTDPLMSHSRSPPRKSNSMGVGMESELSPPPSPSKGLPRKSFSMSYGTERKLSPPPSPPRSLPRKSRSMGPGTRQELEVSKLLDGDYTPANQKMRPSWEASPIRPPTPVTPASPTSPWGPDGEEDDISQNNSSLRPCEINSSDASQGGQMALARRSPVMRTNTPNTLEDVQVSFGLGDASHSQSSKERVDSERVDSDIGPYWIKEDVSMDDIMHVPSVAEKASQQSVDDELLNASVGSVLHKYGASSTESRLWDSAELDADSLVEASLEGDLRGKASAESAD